MQVRNERTGQACYVSSFEFLEQHSIFKDEVRPTSPALPCSAIGIWLGIGRPVAVPFRDENRFEPSFLAGKENTAYVFLPTSIGTPSCLFLRYLLNNVRTLPFLRISKSDECSLTSLYAEYRTSQIDTKVAQLQAALDNEREYTVPEEHDPSLLLFQGTHQLGVATLFMEPMVYMMATEVRNVIQSRHPRSNTRS